MKSKSERGFSWFEGFTSPRLCWFCVLLLPLLAHFTVLAQTNCTPAPSGLVGWWPADGFAFDVAGTNNGTLQGGATYTNGLVGQAFSLNGSSAYVSLNGGTTNLPLGKSPRTIAAWVKTTMSGMGQIVSYGTASTSETFTFGVTGASIFDVGSAGMCEPVPYLNAAATATKWTTIGFAMQVSGLADQGNVVVYSSTNLVTWKPLFTNPPAFGTIQFLDTNATKFPMLFYCVLQQLFKKKV